MSTKQKGDIAEQAAILKALRLGWGVSTPVGDRMPYDLIFDVEGQLVKIQIKSSWFDPNKRNYTVDTRRTKTNRRVMKRDLYQESDFDFALVYIDASNLFYIFPVDIFISYGSTISIIETDKRQRKPKSANYRDAWNLILQWAARRGNSRVTPAKFGEASSSGNPEPSSDFISEKV